MEKYEPYNILRTFPVQSKTIERDLIKVKPLEATPKGMLFYFDYVYK